MLQNWRQYILLLICRGLFFFFSEHCRELYTSSIDSIDMWFEHGPTLSVMLSQAPNLLRADAELRAAEEAALSTRFPQQRGHRVDHFIAGCLHRELQLRCFKKWPM